MLRLLPIAFLLGLSACAIPNSGSNKVVITDTKGVVESCLKIADIDGSSPVSGLLLRDPARDAAITRLKLAAAERGATHVLTGLADVKWKGPDISGVAYRC